MVRVWGKSSDIPSKKFIFIFEADYEFLFFMWSVSAGWKVNSKSKARLPSHLIQREINIFSKPKGNIYWNRGKFPKADSLYLTPLGTLFSWRDFLQALQPSMDLLGFLHRQISLCLIHIFSLHKEMEICTMSWFPNALVSGRMLQTENRMFEISRPQTKQAGVVWTKLLFLRKYSNKNFSNSFLIDNTSTCLSSLGFFWFYRKFNMSNSYSTDTHND